MGQSSLLVRFGSLGVTPLVVSDDLARVWDHRGAPPPAEHGRAPHVQRPAYLLGRHLGRHLTETQRRRWVELMLATVDEVALPDDPEFRAALVGYLEWGTRLAVLNSQDGVVAPDAATPMPVWGWGPPGGPYIP